MDARPAPVRRRRLLRGPRAPRRSREAQKGEEEDTPVAVFDPTSIGLRADFILTNFTGLKG